MHANNTQANGLRALRPSTSQALSWSTMPARGLATNDHDEAKPVRQRFEKKDLIAPMMRIWLGAKPADPQLKAALLGLRT